MSSQFSYTFPAIRGIQASREYYITMCPLRLIPKIFVFNEEELDPQLRAQRVLNKVRIPEMARYIVNNPDSYVFSALTASLDAEVKFVPVSEDPRLYSVGHLHIPMVARFVINDGQHRRAAIEAALRERPSLANETIALVLFIDEGLRRSQQMFADLNRYAIRTTQSLNVLYDYRDPFAKLARALVEEVPVFRGLTEMEKTTISNRSPKLFTLSGIYRASKELLASNQGSSYEELLNLAKAYWNEVACHCEEWLAVIEGRVSAADLRKEYVHAHTVALVALGRAGADLLDRYPHDWRRILARLSDVNWHKKNARQWEGRALVGGKISISRTNVTLMTSEIKRVLGLPLSAEEQAAEDALARGSAEPPREAT